MAEMIQNWCNVFSEMPHHKKSKGVLGTKPHLYHHHWEFTYRDPHASDTDGYEDSLDSDDLETCTYKDQVKIVSGSVLLFVGERETSVTADLYLPVQVTMVVIHKYGQKETFCFACVGGGAQCTVKASSELKKDPH